MRRPLNGPGAVANPAASVLDAARSRALRCGSSRVGLFSLPEPSTPKYRPRKSPGSAVAGRDAWCRTTTVRAPRRSQRPQTRTCARGYRRACAVFLGESSARDARHMARAHGPSSATKWIASGACANPWCSATPAVLRFVVCTRCLGFQREAQGAVWRCRARCRLARHQRGGRCRPARQRTRSTDFAAPWWTRTEALDAIRRFLSYLPSHHREAPPVAPVPAIAKRCATYAFLRSITHPVYDVRR